MRSGIAVATATILALAGAVEAREEDHQGDVNIFLRGGVGDFTGDLTEVTNAGATWGLTVNVQPWNVLGYEVTYDGSRNIIDDSDLADEAALTRHGLAGMLKLAPPFIEKVRPFVGVGLGASIVRVGEEAEGRYKNDLMEEVPLAAGLEFNTGGLTAGLRGTYRWLLDESFANPTVEGNPQGGYLDAAVTLGGRF
jgi:hypothetical protein